MIKGEYEYLANLAKFNVCAEHGTPLEVAWHDKESSNVLRCGQGHYPDVITRQPSLTEMWKQGEELPGHIEDNIERRERRKAMTSVRPNQDLILGSVPRTDLATGELLSPEMIQALMHYANKYALDPYRGHVVLMYGKPYITIDGYLYHANGTKIPYSLTGRPLAEDELKQRGYTPDDLGYISFVKRLDTGQEFEGVGFIKQDEIEAIAQGKPQQKRYPVVAEKPGQMVQKRADWQVLRRAFPIGESSPEKEE